MTQEKLNKIIENHQHWLNQDCEGWENMRAYIRNADLRGVNLHGVNLQGAYLIGTMLCNADLSYANLSYADLRRVELSGADLRGADLHGANLHNTYLDLAKNIPFIPYACPDEVVKQIRADVIDEFVYKVKKRHYVLSDVAINRTGYGMFTDNIEQIAEELKED